MLQVVTLRERILLYTNTYVEQFVVNYQAGHRLRQITISGYVPGRYTPRVMS